MSNYTPTTERVRNSYANDVASYPKPANVYEAACTLVEPEIVLPEIPGTIVIIDPTGKNYCTSAYVLSDTGEWYSDGHGEIPEVVIVEETK